MAYNNYNTNRSSATSVALKRLLKKFKSDTGRARESLIIYQYLVFGPKKLKQNGVSTEGLEDLLRHEELQGRV
tara:strand:+ start:294 stop:512 length:219 start_codon:yes stop_codon:yes gene_type:complete